MGVNDLVANAQAENPNYIDSTNYTNYDASHPVGTVANEESHKRMERYRNERNKFRSRAKELEHSLLKKDENFRDALKKSEVLRSILEEQELEIDSLREYIEGQHKEVDVHELINSKKVKIVRGGGGKGSKIKKKKVNIFTVDELMQNQSPNGKKKVAVPQPQR